MLLECFLIQRQNMTETLKDSGNKTLLTYEFVIINALVVRHAWSSATSFTIDYYQKRCSLMVLQSLRPVVKCWLRTFKIHKHTLKDYCFLFSVDTSVNCKNRRSFWTDQLLNYVDFFNSNDQASTQEGTHDDDKGLTYSKRYLQVWFLYGLLVSSSL